MIKPGFFPSTGKVSYTRPAYRISFCAGVNCCAEIPDTLTCLVQLETGTSGGDVLLHCDAVTLTKDAVGNNWRGTFSWADCIDPDPFEVIFSCDDQSASIDTTNCFQMFGVSIDGDHENLPITLADEDDCCCVDVDEGIMGVEEGPVCLAGGQGTLWTGARGGDGTGCEAATWAEIDEDEGSFPIVWIYDTDEYGDTCCQPSPCPDATHCPSNPCAMAAMMGGHPVPEEVERWFNGLE